LDAAERRRLNDWIVRYADGDRSLFDALFRAVWPMTLGIARRLLANPADAEDAAQQATLNMFSRIAEFDRSRDGVSWVAGVAAYEAMTLRRRRERRRETSEADADQIPSLAKSPEVLVEQAEVRAALIETIGRLSAADQDALSYAIHGVDPKTDDTSRKRRLRAIDRLRSAWRKLYG
jgi:RNA polymerase sigma-70 factor (ECF subfamily)